MKKAMKSAFHVFLVCVLLCTSIFSAYADTQGISPRLTNLSDATLSFVVADNEACFVATFVAYEETFLKAELRVTVEKKVLGLVWRNVGGEWIGYSFDWLGDIAGSVPADGKGTYRANFKLYVYGNQGIADVIEDTIDVRYT